MAHTIVRSSQHKYTLLARLRDQRCLILLHSRPGDAQPSLSMLLAIDRENDTLILDTPIDYQQLNLEPDNALRITASLQGIDLRFRCQFQGLVEYESDSALQVSLPEELKYLERRSAYRVRISGTPAGLELSNETELATDGQLIDLSPVGFGALIEDSPFICEGEVLDCKLQFNKRCVTVQADIRRKSAPSARGYCHIGARFVGLGRREKRALERIVAQFERQAIRSDPTR